MSDEKLLCITHYTADLKPCYRAIHYADCDDPETCRGCVPREAVDGLVCGTCSGRLHKALTNWTEFLTLFAGEQRAVQPEPGGSVSKPSSTVPLSPLQLTIDEILRYVASRPGADRLWVTTPTGAADAVRFTRAVERAKRQFPSREDETKIRNSRCPACGIQSLVYEPAQEQGGEAFVRCLRHECGNIMDHTAFERLALIEAQCCRRCRDDEGCTNTDCTCHRFAPIPEWQRTRVGDFEPLDPKNAAHRALLEAS